MLKHPSYFHFRQAPIDKSALIFFHKHLLTILVITFEPPEVFSYVTNHLKARNPLYKVQGPLFLDGAILGKMVYTPRLVVNFLRSSGNLKVSNIFYQDLVVK